MYSACRWTKPEGQFLRVQRRLPGVKTTEVEVHMATYSFFFVLKIIDGRLPTGSINQISITTVVEVASGIRAMHKRHLSEIQLMTVV